MKPLYVSLTFDDGWKSAVDCAYPLLQKYEVPATFYIISDMVGETHTEYMDLKDLQLLASRGHEIGAHTRSHKHLSELSDKEIWSEISQGVEDLRALGFQPRTFAYPYGEWSPYVVKQVREAGFFGARTIERGINGPRVNHLLLRAFGMHEVHAIQEITSWIVEAKKTGGWLVLNLHQIEAAAVLQERKWIYGTTPEILEGVISFLKKENIEVLTLEKGLERLVTDVLA